MSRQENLLAAACIGMSGTAKRILDWIDDNGSFMAAERVALLHEVYRTETSATTLARAATDSPCVAFVGPPRSGKTNLIASMIERNGGTLAIRFDGIREQVAYLKQIAPDSSKTGSAAVVRLTASLSDGAQNFPVAIRLLSSADIVKILGAAFMSGAERADLEPSMAMIDRLVADAQARTIPESVPGLNEEDIWNIRHYFTARFGEEPLIRALLTGGYWERLTELIPNLQPPDRARLLSVLWGGAAPMTALFVSLTEALASLGHGREARCALDSLLGLEPRTGRFQRRPDNILNAQTLATLGQSDDQTVVVCTTFGQWVSVSRSVLAAIVAELRLAVAGAPGEILERADILEFPSIEPTTAAAGQLRSLQHDPGQLGQLFMSAKSIYLLERYTEEQALTGMVVCLEAGASKVGALAGLVGRWVDCSHGAEPAERELQANGLFVCFTKIDRDFAEPGRRTRERRPDWSRRLTSVLHEGFGRDHNWPASWTTMRGFDNVHLVRSAALRAKSLIAYASDGREHSLKPEQKERLELLGRDFRSNPTVRAHVADPATVWREAFELNDGGASYLAQSIANVCDQRAKCRHILHGLRDMGHSLRDRLRRYHVATAAELQRDRRLVAALGVTRRLRRCVEEQRLGHLVRSLQLTDTEFNDVLLRHQEAPQHQATLGETSRVATSVGAAAVHPSSNPAITIRATPSLPAPDIAELEAQARLYAQILMSHWVASARLFAQSDRIGQLLKMPRASLLQLVDELIAGAVRLDLEQRIAAKLETVMAGVDDPASRIARAALCGANIISDYVMWLGFSDVGSNNHPRRRGRAASPIFPPRATHELWSTTDEPDQTFDQDFFNDWSQAFLALVADSADDLVNRTIDPQSNAKLGELLAELEVSL